MSLDRRFRTVQVKANEPAPEKEWTDTDEEIPHVNASTGGKKEEAETPRIRGGGRVARARELDARNLRAEQTVVFHTMNYWVDDSPGTDDDPKTPSEEAGLTVEVEIGGRKEQAPVYAEAETTAIHKGKPRAQQAKGQS